MRDLLISKNEVEKIAQLSKLDIKGQEEIFTEIFDETLSYVQNLNELDTSKVKETFQVTGLENVFQQPGEEPTTLTQSEALSNRDTSKKGLFETKAVFDR